MNALFYDRFDSPIGKLTIVSDGSHLRHLRFARHQHPAPDQAQWQAASAQPLLQQAREQLLQYLHGERQQFELPLAPSGTDFQRQVWLTLAQIPFGTTWSYQQLARQIGRPAANRAVGAANGRNPLPIILPCHRVIGSNGSLTGFAGGLEAKKALLTLEARQACAHS